MLQQCLAGFDLLSKLGGAEFVGRRQGCQATLTSRQIPAEALGLAQLGLQGLVLGSLGLHLVAQTSQLGGQLGQQAIGAGHVALDLVVFGQGLTQVLL